MGKKDEYPQFITFEVEESAINTLTTEEVNIPVDYDANEIVEFLYLEGRQTLPERVDNTETYSQFSLREKTQTTIGFESDDDVVVRNELYRDTEVGAAGETEVLSNLHNVKIDLRKGGMGILYPFNTIVAHIAGIGSSANKMSFKGRLFYRFVKISSQEIIQALRSE